MARGMPRPNAVADTFPNRRIPDTERITIARPAHGRFSQDKSADLFKLTHDIRLCSGSPRMARGIRLLSTWIRREKRYPSGFQGSESVDLGQDLMSRLLDEL